MATSHLVCFDTTQYLQRKFVLIRFLGTSDINQMEEEISDARGNDERTNFTLRRTPFIY